MQEPTTRFVIPSVVSSHFHIRDGDIVADFGAGVGNFIPELSKRAGPDGRVYACEIQKNLIEKYYLKKKLEPSTFRTFFFRRKI